ncbi:C40 family peptidase [Chitiniphilus eburneus]|nr:C40 family peptidase [Chitiniphilus eburneus]
MISRTRGKSRMTVKVSLSMGWATASRQSGDSPDSRASSEPATSCLSISCTCHRPGRAPAVANAPRAARLSTIPRTARAGYRARSKPARPDEARPANTLLTRETPASTPKNRPPSSSSGHPPGLATGKTSVVALQRTMASIHLPLMIISRRTRSAFVALLFTQFLSASFADEPTPAPASPQAHWAQQLSEGASDTPSGTEPKKNWGSKEGDPSQDQAAAQGLLLQAMGLIGVKYKYGGNDPESGLDCSGFVRYVFQSAMNVALPHNALAMSRLGATIERDALKPGDLVFFNTLGRAFSHVGIYLGEDRFIHAPRAGRAVEIENINLSYWKTRWNGARRVDGSSMTGVNVAALLATAGTPPARATGDDGGSCRKVTTGKGKKKRTTTVCERKPDTKPGTKAKKARATKPAASGKKKKR